MFYTLLQASDMSEGYLGSLKVDPTDISKNFERAYRADARMTVGQIWISTLWYELAFLLVPYISVIAMSGTIDNGLKQPLEAWKSENIQPVDQFIQLTSSLSDKLNFHSRHENKNTI